MTSLGLFLLAHWQVICFFWSLAGLFACGLYWLLSWDSHHGPLESWPVMIGSSIFLMMCGPIAVLTMIYALGEPERQARRMKKQYGDLADELIERTGGDPKPSGMD
ncbi:MAG: hypothetical protein A3B30_01590 [Candidatus Komeilibacteria bacterium RIFCSPLOWO2_01_FULL_52_15]|uniref:Uncharacterized protein n=1 Tax=Candidatus Komeilibacteria bacterium RIFCSPLOWO2_01_FULL_52_15 TaxID=1798551 RepID=A0A1G2BS91_9BACT|nr:MAG: hypothetical protein A3B30_01590 [Candidatus Komeilibacteria bacterium RIFCSPLOWO2_01_FULL_52_15]